MTSGIQKPYDAGTRVVHMLGYRWLIVNGCEYLQRKEVPNNF
jgi:hypothetical protein